MGRDGKLWWVRGSLHIAIHSSYRNKGIGRLLLAWSKDFVLNHAEFERLTLYVSDNNKNAIHLYEKMGFYIEKSNYNFISGLFFKEPNWHFMTCKVKALMDQKAIG
ncbi:GNAT family N-acetyltransferase [Paenibacillus profundus]|uniref:GNAT family N-acetyltransferase n=1 Tax=Paenibacillus profundus TaxID=1173085 RepID=A0ABS8YMZ9_9BACL|nr:N-acetyltransferase [Paenibacillus profundus]MCE5172354.1 GNAT family N-acetyltransferase [Paenibacillus profundus]